MAHLTLESPGRQQPKPPGRPALTAEQIVWAKEAVANGASQTAVAGALHRDVSAISRAVRGESYRRVEVRARGNANGG